MTQPSPAAMRSAAARLLAGLGEEATARAHLPFEETGARRWLEYRPRPRPGACLADLDRDARKAAFRLLATGLSPHAYAQATTIMGLEEVLDRQEGGGRGRHSNDFYVVVFGDPADGRWGWRFEGHHLSVNMTVDGDRVHPTPVFLGANPATVSYAGRPVVRPLAPEQDLAFDLLDAMGQDARAEAVVAERAPADIHSATRVDLDGRIDPPGVAAGQLNATARALLDQLVAAYLARLPADLAAAEADRVDTRAAFFAWEGPVPAGPGRRHDQGHYYRIQASDLLIEYDNTANAANHAHTVLRRPSTDFGGDPLARHHAESHADAG